MRLLLNRSRYIYDLSWSRGESEVDRLGRTTTRKWIAELQINSCGIQNLYNSLWKAHS